MMPRRSCPPRSAVLLAETATTVAILIVAVLVVAVVIADLVTVVAVEDQDNATPTTWKSRIHSCRSRIIEAVPLTAIKIVLVAWQIITQVRG